MPVRKSGTTGLRSHARMRSELAGSRVSGTSPLVLGRLRGSPAGTRGPHAVGWRPRRAVFDPAERVGSPFSTPTRTNSTNWSQRLMVRCQTPMAGCLHRWSHLTSGHQPTMGCPPPTSEPALRPVGSLHGRSPMAQIVLAHPFALGLVLSGHRLAAAQRSQNGARLLRVAAACSARLRGLSAPCGHRWPEQAEPPDLAQSEGSSTSSECDSLRGHSQRKP